MVISAASGSISGTRGISTRPPPSRRVGDSARVTVVVVLVGFGVRGADGCAVRVVVEVRAEDRLGGHRAHRRRRVDVEVVEAGSAGLRCPAAGSSVVLGCRSRSMSVVGHQSEYLATGGAGAGPSTVNHLRYNVFHVPSRRMRSSVPLTKRTSPVFCQVDADAVGLLVHAGPDDVQVRVLRHQPGQDRVVGADRVDLPLLQRHQAVGPRHHRRR